MAKRKTAGELSLKAASDKTKYDPLEVAHALCDDVMDQLRICAERHKSIIDEPEFCVVMILADDPLIKGLLRRKFYAWPYLPKPRPRQSCFLYRRGTDDFKHLWVLPDALSMAVISEMKFVAKHWKNMKGWSDAFFSGTFFDYIRSQHGISMLSEGEYLEANREKLIEAGCKQTHSLPAEPFDFSKISVKQVVDADKSLAK